MNPNIVRCRCGHQVLGREVLRTESCEKASGEQVVYVKYRCRRCKKIGEAFIAHHEWNPAIFEAPANEMGAAERDRFIDEGAISSGDVISFHRALQKANFLSDLTGPKRRKADKKSDKRAVKDKDVAKDAPRDDKPQDKPPRRSRGK